MKVLDFSIVELDTEPIGSKQKLDGCDICMHCHLLRKLMEGGTDALPENACAVSGSSSTDSEQVHLKV